MVAERRRIAEDQVGGDGQRVAHGMFTQETALSTRYSSDSPGHLSRLYWSESLCDKFDELARRRCSGGVEHIFSVD